MLLTARMKSPHIVLKNAKYGVCDVKHDSAFSEVLGGTRGQSVSIGKFSFYNFNYILTG